MSKSDFNKQFIFGITAVSAMGGLLFGYDWVVIGGAKPFYERFFDIASIPHLQGWAMSSALIGCFLGAITSGFLADKFGRKLLLIIAAALFTISAIGTGAVNNFTVFILFRLIGGLGIGLASAVSPMYIAEISPAHIRGRLVSVNQLTIVIGILAAQIINYLIADNIAADATDADILNSWNGQMGWRWMFWAEVVPASVFFLMAFFIPESPRFLVKTGKTEKAAAILTRIGGKEYALAEEKNIEHTLTTFTKKIAFGDLVHKDVKPILIIGIVLAAFQQWCGVNVVFNYAEEVFVSAGYSVGDMLFNIIITGAVNLIFTLVAMRVVDTIGRRKLMLFGSIGLAVIYFILGGSYMMKLDGTVILILVLFGIATYAMTLAPITWVVLSEIFPNRIRGAAMAVATTALWIASFLLTYTFPFLNKLFHAGGTFWLYAFICLAGFLFILKRLPETKGKTLEEIEEELKK
ncbi:sugar porter family MFS transporter [Draconibacterium sp. IB214405]|uniref:sugar porter family MFS transporter n=1 Tax=Draconibacterium sp. IB214405 TaxID=3097352 RepID=UPI002A0CFA3E|nr:sugar porter family MFS transporter [Draconibacterium sp. IB214405]MDX8339368.1 sugar porter family MFS transporter [Draconibacterium sp. IB214405]